MTFHHLPSFIVHAADQWTGTQSENVATFASLESLFKNIVSAVTAIVGVALFIMILVSGFSFLFSAGDPKKLEQARGTFTNAIIGLVVIVCAYLILLIIKVFTGVDVTHFHISIPNNP